MVLHEYWLHISSAGTVDTEHGISNQHTISTHILKGLTCRPSRTRGGWLGWSVKCGDWVGNQRMYTASASRLIPCRCGFNFVEEEEEELDGISMERLY